MAATVTIRQAYGGSDGSPGSESSDLTSASTRLQTQDTFDATNETHPVPIPTAGFKYSYWIHVYLKIETAPSVKINNIRHYFDGTIGWAMGTGGMLMRGNRDTGDIGAPMDTEYDVATGTAQDTGDAIDDGANGHDYYKAQTSPIENAEVDTVGSPATIDSTDHTETGKSKAIVLQVKVASDATSGEQTDEEGTWKYDEI